MNSFNSNIYLDEGTVPTLGTAIMFLNGVLLRLERDVESNDTTRLRDSVVYSHALISLYKKSYLNSPKDNILNHKYRLVGDITIKELGTKLQKCSSLLASALKISHF